MTDKEKIRAEIERRRNEIKKEELSFDNYSTGWHDGNLDLLCDLLSFIDSMQEEPKSKFEQSIQEGDNIVYNEDLGCRVNLSQLKRVAKKEEPASEGLEKELSRLLKDCEIDSEYIHQDFLHIVANHFAQWQKEQMMKNIWKPADGDDLPEYDREVIAILDYDFGHYKVVYAHRPNPDGWNGTNIDTEEKEHFEPEIYDKGGWNQPHVLYWLDTILPYEENKIDKEIAL